MVFIRVPWSPVESNPLHECLPVTKVHMDSTWTVQSSGLQWIPVMTDISRLGCGESPLESSGVHMEYGGDRQELLRSTKDLLITFGGQKGTMVEGFCDVDWASQKHKHSISGFSFHFGIAAISWSSKKQGVVSLSSTEVEYVVQMHAAKEGIWLRIFMKEIWGGEEKPLTISCDNQGAIALAKDSKFHVRTKHIDLWYHFIHEAVKHGKIQVKYIDMVYKCACTDATILANHFCKF